YQQGYARSGDCQIGYGHSLALRILNHLLTCAEMVDAVVEEESSEDQAAEQKRKLHPTCPSTVCLQLGFFARGKGGMRKRVPEAASKRKAGSFHCRLLPALTEC